MADCAHAVYRHVQSGAENALAFSSINIGPPRSRNENTFSLPATVAASVVCESVHENYATNTLPEGKQTSAEIVAEGGKVIPHPTRQ